MIQIILQWTIPTILTIVLGYFTTQLKENKENNELINKHNEAMKESMVLLLRSQITGKAETYMDLGYLPDYARSCMEDLFQQYKALGGNHGVEALVKKCFDLPPIRIEKR